MLCWCQSAHFTMYASWIFYNALFSVWDTQKCITGTQTFLTSKLGGWKHTTAFHKLSQTNRHQTLKHRRQHWYNSNLSVIGNSGGRSTFQNWSDIGQEAGKLHKRRSCQNTVLRRGASTSAVLFRKRKTYSVAQCNHKGPRLANKRCLTSLDWM